MIKFEDATFSTAYNAKRAASRFLITNRLDADTQVDVIKVGEKFTYALPLAVAPADAAAVAEDHEQAQFAEKRAADVLEGEIIAPRLGSLDSQIEPGVGYDHKTHTYNGKPILTPEETQEIVAVEFLEGCEPDEDAHLNAVDDDETPDVGETEEPMRVENADEAAAVAQLEAEAQAKAAKRKPRMSHDEKIAARLASAEQPAPVRATKAAQPRKQREPKAEGAAPVARVKRADGLTEGSSMAKLVDYAMGEPRTNAELCAHVGWAQCLPMLRKGAEKTGRKLDITKVQGEPTRYRVVGQAAA